MLHARAPPPLPASGLAGREGARLRRLCNQGRVSSSAGAQPREPGAGEAHRAHQEPCGLPGGAHIHAAPLPAPAGCYRAGSRFRRRPTTLAGAGSPRANSTASPRPSHTRHPPRPCTPHPGQGFADLGAGPARDLLLRPYIAGLNVAGTGLGIARVSGLGRPVALGMRAASAAAGTQQRGVPFFTRLRRCRGRRVLAGWRLVGSQSRLSPTPPDPPLLIPPPPAGHVCGARAAAQRDSRREQVAWRRGRRERQRGDGAAGARDRPHRQRGGRLTWGAHVCV